jgi:transposase
MKDYYVYVWKNPETNKIFYIGKGKGRRAWNSHAKYRSGYKLKNLLKRGFCMKDIVSIFKDNLTEIDALKIENSLIKKYKRIEEGGTLLNYALNGGRISNKKKKQIDPDILNDIKILYEQRGLSASSICKRYNVSSGTIIRWLRLSKASIRPNSLPKKTINKHKKRVIEMYGVGYSIKKIAKIYNVCPTTVLRILKESKIELKGRRIKFSPVDLNDIIKQYLDGCSSTAIAKKYNVRCCTILRALKENNILIRNNSEAQKYFNNTKLQINKK